MKVSTLSTIQRFLSLDSKDFALRLRITPFHLSRLRSRDSGSQVSPELAARALEVLHEGFRDRQRQEDLAFIIAELAQDHDLAVTMGGDQSMIAMLRKWTTKKGMGKITALLSTVHGETKAGDETPSPSKCQSMLNLLLQFERSGIDTSRLLSPGLSDSERQFVESCLRENGISKQDLLDYDLSGQSQGYKSHRHAKASTIAAILRRHGLSARDYLLAKGIL